MQLSNSAHFVLQFVFALNLQHVNQIREQQRGRRREIATNCSLTIIARRGIVKGGYSGG